MDTLRNLQRHTPFIHEGAMPFKKNVYLRPSAELRGTTRQPVVYGSGIQSGIPSPPQEPIGAIASWTSLEALLESPLRQT